MLNNKPVAAILLLQKIFNMCLHIWKYNKNLTQTNIAIKELEFVNQKEDYMQLISCTITVKLWTCVKWSIFNIFALGYKVLISCQFTLSKFLSTFPLNYQKPVSLCSILRGSVWSLSFY